jgi:DNA replication protein DnaC
MDKKQQIKQYCQQFKITGISKQVEELIAAAEKKSTGFLDFTVTMLKAEAEHRHDNELQRRIKTATLPVCVFVTLRFKISEPLPPRG